ncbi:hypothetical protein ADK55_14935 [Streptomyces sp. WM4235]|uniref:hypothetical protein n=1 Tax=Streptomyces sp. WM4235 TaxID=1415551 RepID=UPI0006B06A4D|nr:hypothetical protein [Streptomyces sp. WM4235]KOU54008.1 hypothetical protein ADK55_14935 [Streptomyces sp. WM4235]
MGVKEAPSAPARRTAGDLVAEFDQERPARKLSPAVSAAVSALCAGLSIFVLYAVFFPVARGGQYYLTLFLAAALPLIFLTYRGTGAGAGFHPAVAPERGLGAGQATYRDDPGWFDWVLAAENVNAAASEIDPAQADGVAPLPLNHGAENALKALTMKPRP